MVIDAKQIHLHFIHLFYFFCFEISVIRKRSSKSEGDGFLFPDLSVAEKCGLEVLAGAQVQKLTTAPVTQHHVFTEPKPKVSRNKCRCQE